MIDLKEILKSDVPLIDVRAPIEFNAGHFPCSTNLPLMNDSERAQVGTRYRHEGQTAAIALGHELVAGKLKEERIDSWHNFISKNPKAKLYCFRGGLRSQISTQWLKSRGTDIEFIPGGYKALRKTLLDVIEQTSANRPLLILAGRTGSGKTKLLSATKAPFLDLEKAAHHKGSSFGVQGPQPAQITFENRIGVDLLKHPIHPYTLVEDESIMIGSAIVPRILFQKMLSSPMVLLERPLQERIQHIVDEYVIERSRHENQDFRSVETFMLTALKRIEKKLGGLNTTGIQSQMRNAFSNQDPSIPENHFEWVESLLKHYYDPLYDRSLKKHESRILFRGSEAECLNFMESYKPL